MPPRRIAERLQDMVAAIESIERDVSGMTAEELADDDKTTRAVLFGLIVLGEAAANIPDEFASRHPDIPWARARDLRSLIAHAYFRVDMARIWDTIKRDLPPLAVSLRAALTAAGDE